MNLGDIATLNIKGSDYRFTISRINKRETINLIQNTDFAKKKEHYKTILRNY